MSTFYNTSTVTYNDATVTYNGVAIVYSYSGSVTIMPIMNSSYNKNGGVTTYSYVAMMDIIFDSTSPYRTGFIRTPSITGLTARIVPNSSMVIRQYKKVKDPIRTGGCPNCGTFLYDN